MKNEYPTPASCHIGNDCHRSGIGATTLSGIAPVDFLHSSLQLNRVLAQDGDSSEGSNTRIVATLSADVIYVLMANS